MIEGFAAAVHEVAATKCENFQEIKPHNKEMTVKEANGFWKNEFAKEEQDVKENDSKEHFDDNGTKYREAEQLLPDTAYESNGYKYETDDKGRIVSAEGTLRIEENHPREMESVRNYERQEYKETDERGHLIAHMFGGSDKLDNLVPMDADLNHGDYLKMENTLADAIKDGKTVNLKIEPVYEGESGRPSEFRISYSIDGEKTVTVFKNGKEGA